jgi:hypothetical protein
VTIDFDAPEGLSRRSMLTPSAAGLGIARSGSVSGLFGTAAFVRNEDPENSECTGPTFSHDPKTLFADMQVPGYVYAIMGPFKKQRC